MPTWWRRRRGCKRVPNSLKVAELWMWKITSRDEKAFSLTVPPRFFLFFDVWGRCACAHVREILGITEAFPLCSSHTVKPLTPGRKNTHKVDSSGAPPRFALCLLCAAFCLRRGRSRRVPLRRLVSFILPLVGS